jgi:hypothetical protein
MHLLMFVSSIEATTGESMDQEIKKILTAHNEALAETKGSLKLIKPSLYVRLVLYSYEL